MKHLHIKVNGKKYVIYAKGFVNAINRGEYEIKKIIC